jgi:alpha,alpha-trehalase
MWLALAAAISVPSAQAAEIAESQNSEASSQILRYIHEGWHTLTRSTNECASLSDSKLLNPSRVLYLPKDMKIPTAVSQLGEQCAVHIEFLPLPSTHLGQIRPHNLLQPGLLYLPNPYVVPGGRFNEMYGWDSYFIVRGLIEDGELNLARGMVENFFFEIENYGSVLNANRTYYLTRSQPPFLSSMILAIHHANVASHQDDAAWLDRAYQYAQRDYKLWMTAPKLDPATGLSRYYDFGSGPVQEIGDHNDYYIKVADWLVKHPEVPTDYLTDVAAKGTGTALHVPLCGNQPCEKSKTVWLKPEFYKGDRAMRESGFDITFRFGPFGGSTQDHAPVCLNSLLYKVERDLSELATDLGRPSESRHWRQLAKHRKQLINRYLWDTKNGFEDYNLRRHQRSNYLYASIFYPLWTGLATPAQARAVRRHLFQLEYPGGLAMSDRETGAQWDKPYGWAPIQLIAVEGLRRYGFNDDADRISHNFLTMVAENEKREGSIREKYNVVNRSTVANVTAGYASNVVGFGWTNGTFLVLLHELSAREQQSILNDSARADGIAPTVLPQGTSQNHASTLESSAIAPVSRFPLSFDALTIHQAAQLRNPFSLTGETAAILGQQDGSFELWDFPAKVLAHVRLHVELASDRVPIDGNALAATIDVSPDHTSITYIHAAFTVKQHMFIARAKDGHLLGRSCSLRLPQYDPSR